MCLKKISVDYIECSGNNEYDMGTTSTSSDSDGSSHSFSSDYDQVENVLLVLHSTVKQTSRSDALNWGNNKAKEDAVSASEDAVSEEKADQLDQESIYSTSLWSEVYTVESVPELWSDPEYLEWTEEVCYGWCGNDRRIIW